MWDASQRSLHTWATCYCFKQQFIFLNKQTNHFLLEYHLTPSAAAAVAIEGTKEKGEIPSAAEWHSCPCPPAPGTLALAHHPQNKAHQLLLLLLQPQPYRVSKDDCSPMADGTWGLRLSACGSSKAMGWVHGTGEVWTRDFLIYSSVTLALSHWQLVTFSSLVLITFSFFGGGGEIVHMTLWQSHTACIATMLFPIPVSHFCHYHF